MNYSVCMMVFLITLIGCDRAPLIEGKVVSSKEIGPGVMEHYVETNYPQIPYYTLKTETAFVQGSKVVLELPVNSMAAMGY